jgi:hypothetical protein
MSTSTVAEHINPVGQVIKRWLAVKLFPPITIHSFYLQPAQEKH